MLFIKRLHCDWKGLHRQAATRANRLEYVFQGVTPFSRWEKELPKLITDPRYTAVGLLKERRLIFDDFCKTSADEHKRSKADHARKSREDFQVLLEEAAKAGTAGMSFMITACDSTWEEIFSTPGGSCHSRHPCRQEYWTGRRSLC